MLIPLCCPFRRLFQAALSGMSCDYVTAGDVDKAFPPGQGIPDSFQRCPLLNTLVTHCNSLLHPALLACMLHLTFTVMVYRSGRPLKGYVRATTAAEMAR